MAATSQTYKPWNESINTLYCSTSFHSFGVLCTTCLPFVSRVSEEKEESVQRLKDEHESFERKIQQLEQQNVLIAHERESMFLKYHQTFTQSPNGQSETLYTKA